MLGAWRLSAQKCTTHAKGDAKMMIIIVCIAHSVIYLLAMCYSNIDDNKNQNQ